MFRAALIDVGGTLWPDRWPPSAEPLYIERLCQAFSLKAEEAQCLLRQLQEHDPAHMSHLPLRQDSVAMTTLALDGAGLERIDPSELLMTMDLPACGVIDLLPGARAFLHDIRNLRLRSILLSNATFRSSSGYRRDFAAFSLDLLIDGVISSVDLGYRKPSREMFAAAVDAAATSPSQCVVVGDSEVKDIAPAKALGMKAVRVCIEEPLPAFSEADAAVASLEEAASVISSWHRQVHP